VLQVQRDPKQKQVPLELPELPVLPEIQDPQEQLDLLGHRVILVLRVHKVILVLPELPAQKETLV
jgi:hypothetical protein